MVNALYQPTLGLRVTKRRRMGFRGLDHNSRRVGTSRLARQRERARKREREGGGGEREGEGGGEGVRGFGDGTIIQDVWVPLGWHVREREGEGVRKRERERERGRKREEEVSGL